MTAECVAVLSSNIATWGVSCVVTNSDELFVPVIRRSDWIDDGVNATVSFLSVVVVARSTSNESRVAFMVRV